MPDVDNDALARAILAETEAERRQREARLRMRGFGHRYHPYRDWTAGVAAQTPEDFFVRKIDKRIEIIS